MTREEAKTRLKRIYNDFDGTVDDCHAISMAIQALSQEPNEWSEMLVICDNCGHAIHVKNEDYEQEPCTDAVSRAEVKRIVDFYKEQSDGIYHINESIDKLPFVTVQSENLCDHCKHFEKCEHDEREFWQAYEQEPCDDCISRQAVVNAIKYAQVNFTINSTINFANYTKEVQAIVDNILSAQIKAINELPPVNPQKSGKWIEVIDKIDSFGNKTWHHKCSICGNEDSGWGNYKYCPNCGTRMRD